MNTFKRPLILALLLVGTLVFLKIAAVPRPFFGGAFVLAGAGVLVAGVRRSFEWLDGWRTALLLLGLSGLYSTYPLLRGDGVEYYALLRSPLFDHDFDLSNDFAGFGFQPLTTPEGKPVARQGVGVALCWAPLVVATDWGVSVADLLGARIPRDGFSPPYQCAATTSTFLFGFAALLLLEGALRNLYGPPVATLSLIALYLATPLHFYLVANPFMSHGVSFFAATVFLLAWLRARTVDDTPTWIFAGAAGGLMALIRAHDTVLLGLPLLDLLLKGRRPRVRLLAAFLLVPACLALLQAFVWWRLYGSEFLGGVLRINRVHGFAFHPWELLLSPRHGLLTWTPLYVLALLGLLLWIRRNAGLALLLLLGVAAALAVNSLFEDWWGSQSFGQRRLLSLSPFFALGLAEVVALLKRKPLVSVAALLAPLVLWNLQFEQIYNSDLVSQKWEAVNLDTLAAAQVDLVYRRVLAFGDRLPPGLFVLLYDNLKGVWLDEGPRSLKGRVNLGEHPEPVSFLIGDGWYHPEAEDGMTFRRSRGRRSSLRIPVLTPGDFRAFLRARLELTETQVELDLDVNGEDCGLAELTPGWHDYTFFIPAHALHSGINDFVLRYSTTPRKERPEGGGKNAVVSVQSLKLNRVSESPTRQ
jgi:hypothetical protein